MTPEGKVKIEILRAIGRRRDVLVWNNPTGTARSLDGKRLITFGCPGSPDILGVQEVVITEAMVGMTFGRALGIEVKCTTDQSKQQQRFESAWRLRGGLYLLARSPDEVVARLDITLR
jgi:hypothetical protein